MTPEWQSKHGQNNPGARHSAQSHDQNGPHPPETLDRKTDQPGYFMRLCFALLVAALTATAAPAMAPLARPEGTPSIETGKSAPFVGAWAVSVPTREVGVRDTDYAICALPVRIEAANETHIFYLGPREKEPDAALELVPDRDGARWEPIAGGPNFFAVWVDENIFYLYDQIPETDDGWDMPFVYRRCN